MTTRSGLDNQLIFKKTSTVYKHPILVILNKEKQLHLLNKEKQMPFEIKPHHVLFKFEYQADAFANEKDLDANTIKINGKWYLEGVNEYGESMGLYCDYTKDSSRIAYLNN
jgi:hypothetical protein